MRERWVVSVYKNVDMMNPAMFGELVCFDGYLLVIDVVQL